MKTNARQVWAIAVLGGALIISGCTTTRTEPRTVGFRPIGATPTLTVVESSTKRELTEQDKSMLRDAVVKYLAGEGLDQSGEYYVRVDFPPAQAGEPGEWMVVKIARQPVSTYTVIAAYPAIGPDDYYPYNLAYGGGYGYWGSSYDYYEPFSVYPANYHYTPFPLNPHRRDDRDNHPRGNDGRNDGRIDRNDGRPDGNHGTPNHGYRPDSNRYTPRPGVPNPGTTDRGGRRDYTPRSPDSGGSRNHVPGNYTPPPPPRGESGGGSYTPPPAPPRNDPPPVRYERNDAETARAQNQQR